jgi:hypothetical protein
MPQRVDLAHNGNVANRPDQRVYPTRAISMPICTFIPKYQPLGHIHVQHPDKTDRWTTKATGLGIEQLNQLVQLPPHVALSISLRNRLLRLRFFFAPYSRPENLFCKIVSPVMNVPLLPKVLRGERNGPQRIKNQRFLKFITPDEYTWPSERMPLIFSCDYLRACSIFFQQQCQKRQHDELQAGFKLALAVLP